MRRAGKGLSSAMSANPTFVSMIALTLCEVLCCEAPFLCAHDLTAELRSDHDHIW